MQFSNIGTYDATKFIAKKLRGHNQGRSSEEPTNVGNMMCCGSILGKNGNHKVETRNATRLIHVPRSMATDIDMIQLLQVLRVDTRSRSGPQTL